MPTKTLIEILQEALKEIKGKEDAKNCFGAAEDFFNKGQFDKAAEVMERYVQENQGNVKGHRILGFCYKGMGRFEEALEQFQPVIGRFASMPYTDEAIGDCYFQLGRFEEAESHYLRATELGERPTWKLLNTFLKQQKCEQILEVIDQVLEGAVSNWRPYQGETVVYRLDDLKRIDKKFPESPDKNYDETKEKVIQFLGKAAKEDDNEMHKSLYLANMYNLQGDDEKLEPELRKLVYVFNAINYPIVSSLCRVYEQKGSFNEAEQIWKRLLQFEPNNPGVYAGIYRCCIAQGRKREAKKAYKTAYRLYGDIAETMLGKFNKGVKTGS